MYYTKLVHCGIWNWCIVGFVQQVYQAASLEHVMAHSGNRYIGRILFKWHIIVCEMEHQNERR